MRLRRSDAPLRHFMALFIRRNIPARRLLRQPWDSIASDSLTDRPARSESGDPDGCRSIASSAEDSTRRKQGGRRKEAAREKSCIRNRGIFNETPPTKLLHTTRLTAVREDEQSFEAEAPKLIV